MRKLVLLTVLAAFAAFAVPAWADTSVKVKPGKTGSKAATALSSVKLKACSSAPYYDARRLEFSAQMAVRGAVAQKMEMRFDVYRKYNEHKRFRKLKAEGLSQWLAGSDPKATVYVREIELAQVETAAKYKTRVTFRWTGEDGKTIARVSRWSKTCAQRTTLPRLVRVGVAHQPIPGSDNHHYTVSLVNTGASEAVNVPVKLVPFGEDSALTATIESIGPGQTAEVGFDGPACGKTIGVVIDPRRVVRQRAKSGRYVVLPC